MDACPRRDAAPQRFRRAARLALLVLPLVLSLSAVGVEADTLATVIPADGLRLRAGPSTDERILDLIPGGTRIAITGQATADGWYPAVYRAQRGWVLGSHLAFDDATAAAARRATVSDADGLNLRAAPAETAAIITVLAAGAAVTVTGRATDDGWALVLVNDQSGWVKAAYLSFESRPAAPSTVAFGASAVASAGATPVVLTYYHPSFEGSRMYCGGVYRADDPTIAATNSWPCGTVLRVCRGAACITVTVRDKGGMGPNHIDLSAAGFARLAALGDSLVTGTAETLP